MVGVGAGPDSAVDGEVVFEVEPLNVYAVVVGAVAVGAFDGEDFAVVFVKLVVVALEGVGEYSE